MASGDTLLIFKPQSDEPPTSNAATHDTRNRQLVLDFDGSANEDAIFKGVLPRIYAGGGITIKLHVSLSSATSGDTDWDAAFERIGIGSQDVDSNGFASVQSADNTIVPATSGHVQVISIAFTDGAQIDSIAVGELFRLKVTRDATSDTAAGDAELHAIELVET